MSDQKVHKITVRFDENERKLLDQRAELQCMSLSQYIRYIMLMNESEEDSDSSELLANKDSNYLEKIRMDVVGARCYAKAVAIKLLDDKEFTQVSDLIKSLYSKYFNRKD